MKKILTLLLATISLNAMERPERMGLVKAILENKIVQTCDSCCRSEFCPAITLVASAEVFFCGCIVNPGMSEHCASSSAERVRMATCGAFLVGLTGAFAYSAHCSNNWLDAYHKRRN